MQSVDVQSERRQPNRIQSDRSAATTARWINGLCVVILGGTLLLERSNSAGPPCLFKMTCHLPCPGCGMTRSLKAIWLGHFTTAFRYHPLGPVLFLLCAALLLSALLQKPLSSTPLSMESLHRNLMLPRTLYSITALMLGFWVIRLIFIACGSHYFLWE